MYLLLSGQGLGGVDIGLGFGKASEGSTDFLFLFLLVWFSGIV